jgi:hypothetical protein
MLLSLLLLSHRYPVVPKKKALSEKQKAKQRRREDKARLPFIPDADLQVLVLYWLVERQAHTHTHTTPTALYPSSQSSAYTY